MVSGARTEFTALDIFSGVGGLARGWLDAIGPRAGRLLGAVDSDPTLGPVYDINFPGTKFVHHRFSALENGDARAIQRALGLRKRDVDVLLAGPPCQSVSSAGKRTDEHPDNRLALRVAELARVLQPRVVIIENVPDFAWVEGGRILGRLRVQLRDAGFETHVGTLNASGFGIPQIRVRCFVIAVAERLFRAAPGPLLPPPTSTALATAAAAIERLMTKLENPPTVQEAIGDLPPLKAGEGSEVVAYGKATPSWYAASMRGESHHVFNHVSVKHSDSTVRALANLVPGETPQRDPKHPLRRREYFRSAYARLLADGLAPTMTTQTHNPGSGRFTHYQQDRVLTVREVARIQSFRDEFRFLGDAREQRRHVGNAVPPLLAQAISAHLLPYFE